VRQAPKIARFRSPESLVDDLQGFPKCSREEVELGNWAQGCICITQMYSMQVVAKVAGSWRNQIGIAAVTGESLKLHLHRSVGIGVMSLRYMLAFPSGWERTWTITQCGKDLAPFPLHCHFTFLNRYLCLYTQASCNAQTCLEGAAVDVQDVRIILYMATQ